MIAVGVVGAALVAWAVYRFFVPSRRQREMIAMVERAERREIDFRAMQAEELAPRDFIDRWYQGVLR